MPFDKSQRDLIAAVFDPDSSCTICGQIEAFELHEELVGAPLLKLHGTGLSNGGHIGFIMFTCAHCGHVLLFDARKVLGI